MYFKKLEIFGFKSFAEKTTLNFEPGITAIVGPNGCGKSNVFDAIRWVLGEQSIKQLRGDSKEDVIFNGTQNTPPLGFAEVSLTFSNESRMLPIEYDEVTIARRLFRSGDSEYLLNKTKVRLKDIQELLYGTGIGAQAYSMVQQGKIDQVVSSKPEDRRVIFDEASGITKYKAKKKEALSKLKSTEENLLRVNDITTEVKRQIGSIERQANKARKYKDEFERLTNLEVQLAKYQMSSFEDRMKELENQVQQLKGNEEQLNQQHDDLSSELTQQLNNLDEMEQKINDLNAQEVKLENDIDMNNRQIGFNQERIQNIQENEQKLIQQKEQLIEKCRAQQGKVDEVKISLATLEGTAQSNRDILKEKQEHLAAVERSIAEAEQKIRDHEEKILSLTSQQVNVRNALTDVMKTIQGNLARKRRLELELEKTTNQKQEVDQKIQNIGYQMSTIEGSICDLFQQLEQKKGCVENIKTRLKSLDEKIQEQEKKRLFLKSQKEFIEKMSSQYDDMPDVAIEGKLITETVPEEHHTGIIGKVMSFKRAPGQKSSFFWQRDRTEKKKYEIVCETKFIELDPQQIITQIDEISDEITKMNLQKDEFEETLNVERQILKEFKEEIQSKEKTQSILEAQKKNITEETKKLSEELDLVKVELDEVTQALEGVKKKEEELNFDLDTVTQDLGWCQNDIKDKQQWIAKRIQEKEEVTVGIAQLETEIQAEQEKFDDLNSNLKHFAQTLDNWLEEIKQIDDETMSQQIKAKEYEEESEELKNKITKIREEKQSLKEVFVQYEQQKEGLGEKINQARRRVTSIEEQTQKIKGDLHKQQLKEQELSFNEKALKDRLLQSYKIDYDQVVQENNEQPSEDEETEPVEIFDVEKAEMELNKLRKRCDSFGNVNLDAMDEYEELKERFEFLTQQQSDLLEAKSHLMSTINKINRSTRQMFMDTFTKVGEEFRIYFRMLFGGGEAELVLLEPDNVLESGIEIVARPPGKKLQSISLLSGGEKTLTAIALIFGVFKVKPSPFCVLDEIDAALDESNVGRFAYLLQDL